MTTMDFPAFVAWSQHVRATRPDVLDVAETRIAVALSPIRPVVAAPAAFPTVHRCHLAQQWCELRSLPADKAPTAFVCDGVRHALDLLFRAFAREGRRVAIPQDVYPIYGRLADAAGVETTRIATFPDLDLPAFLAHAERHGASTVLLPAPLKLHGRAWTSDEGDVAADWLAHDGSRRLILDGVYAFGEPVDATILKLLATDQVFHLDSLSKGWLHELVFGIAVVPERDRARLVDTFRELRPSQDKLWLARELMTRFHDFPARLAGELARRRAVLVRRLADVGVDARPTRCGYLVAIDGNASSLLDTHGVLALPASAFGSDRTDLSIASALAFAGDEPVAAR